MKLAIVVSEFNPQVTGGLLKGAKTFLLANGLSEENILVIDAPGAFEIPLLAKSLAQREDIDGVICLGAVVKGDTAHFEYISQGVTDGILQVMLTTNKPISFGVLTTYTAKQATLRSQDDQHNKGIEAAQACLKTVKILKEISL